MPNLKSSPSPAPAYAHHRRVKTTADSATQTSIKQGMNCQGYRRVNIQVVPTALANPVIQVMFWSAAAAKFIAASTDIAVTAKGAGVSHEFPVDVDERIIFVRVVSGITTGDTVDIHVSGTPVP